MNGGQDGGPIGAFGQGFYSSKNAPGTPNEPPGGGAWSGWVDQNNDLLAMSTMVDVAMGTNEVILENDDTVAFIYSPVFSTGSDYTTLRSLDYAAFEDSTRNSGSRMVIDYNVATPQREVRLCYAETVFSQDPTPFCSGGTIAVVDGKHVKFDTPAKYVQIELVLRRDGQ